jgi:hypothetical protein
MNIKRGSLTVQKVLGHYAAHKKHMVPLSTLCLWGVGRGEVSKLVLGGNNNFQGTFCKLFFLAKNTYA